MFWRDIDSSVSYSDIVYNEVSTAWAYLIKVIDHGTEFKSDWENFVYVRRFLFNEKILSFDWFSTLKFNSSNRGGSERDEAENSNYEQKELKFSWRSRVLDDWFLILIRINLAPVYAVLFSPKLEHFKSLFKILSSVNICKFELI